MKGGKIVDIKNLKKKEGMFGLPSKNDLVECGEHDSALILTRIISC